MALLASRRTGSGRSDWYAACESLPSCLSHLTEAQYAGLEGFSPEYVPEHLDMVNDLFEEVLFSEWNVDKEMDCMYGEDGERLPFHRL